MPQPDEHLGCSWLDGTIYKHAHDCPRKDDDGAASWARFLKAADEYEDPERFWAGEESKSVRYRFQDDITPPQISNKQTEAPGKPSQSSHSGREGSREAKSDGGSDPVL